MKSVKLTNELRDNIWQNIKTAILKPREDQLDKERRILGKKVYTAIIGEDNIKAMNKLPNDFFTRNTRFYTKDENNNRIEIFTNTSVSLPYSFLYNSVTTSQWDNKDKVICELSKYKEKLSEIAKWEKHILECRDTSYRIMKSVNTTKQLMELWPECKNFLPNAIKNVDNAQLPMVQVQELNKTLGLSKE